MIRSVYIAAPFELRDSAKELRDALKADVVCTSHWLDSDQPADIDAARLDLADILRAEAIVFLNPKGWATQGTGGRPVEIGFALANNMPVFMLGSASNVFHTLPEVVVLSTVAELRETLQLVKPQPRRPVTHAEMIASICARVHKANEKWWIDINTGAALNRNVGELLMLVVSELAEAMEGHRKNLHDDKLPHRRMFEVELADAIIRIADICGGLHFDLGGAFEEKMDYNAVRVDHTHAHRMSDHGKKY